MEVRLINIEKIKPYFQNPRKNKDAIKYVAESIKEFGFKVPITIDKDYVIITGHTRYEASKLLKIKMIPCIIVEDISDEKIKAFRLADNKVAEFARWDYSKLEEEMKNIKDIKMELYGFIEDEEINWDNIEEISVDNYEEPEHQMIECPYCNHIDRKEKYKKVRANKMSDEL